MEVPKLAKNNNGKYYTFLPLGTTVAQTSESIKIGGSHRTNYHVYCLIKYDTVKFARQAPTFFR